MQVEVVFFCFVVMFTKAKLKLTDIMTMKCCFMVKISSFVMVKLALQSGTKTTTG